MLHYVLQVISFQLIFLIVYDLFLKKETFFNYNRIYLLSTAIVSFALPFIKVEKFKTIVPENFSIRLPEVILGTNEIDTAEASLNVITTVANPETSLEWSWEFFIVLGMLVAAIFLVAKFLKLGWLISKNPKRWRGDLLIIKLSNSSAAFSFFHYVFLGEQLPPEEASTILDHERIHVNEKHSLDLLFFEIMRVVFWFNPLVYMYQNRIRTLHEYIADSKAVKLQGKEQYYQNLLTQIFETKDLSFVNTFYKKSLLKKRIIMLSQSKSKQLNILKYALFLPSVFVMLLYTSTYAQHKVEAKTEALQELTDAELEEKYYKELKDKAEINYETLSEYLPSSNKYILTRDELFKQKAVFRYLNESKKNQLKEDGLRKKQGKNTSQILNTYKTYNEYLAYKKTDEAKRAWDNQTQNGVLRLVVDDIGNLTAEEQQRFDKKLNMIENDDYFRELLIVEVSGRTKTIIHDVKPASKAPVLEVTEVEEIDEMLEVPFSLIEESPTFKSCANLNTNEERRQCLITNVSKHVNQNFNIKLAESLGLVGRQRISVLFKIDKEGNVIGIKARAPHPELENEAKRVIAALPQLVPGKHKGKKVIVPYSLPIVFQINSTKKEGLKEYQDTEAIPYAQVDEPPVAMSCGHTTDKKFRKSCTSQAVASHVNKNFNMKMAEKLKLEGVQKIKVLFKIDKTGHVTDVKARAPHPDLEEEAKRVIYTLPKFTPGKHKGEVVDVFYSLPIQFKFAQ